MKKQKPKSKHAKLKAQGHGSKYPAMQQRAIFALLQSPSVEAAARSLGVCRQTLSQWMTRADFQSAYHRAALDQYRDGLAALQSAVPKAVIVLHQSLNGKTPLPVKVKAAIAVVELAAKAAALVSVFERLTDLETEMRRLPPPANVPEVMEAPRNSLAVEAPAPPLLEHSPLYGNGNPLDEREPLAL